MNSIRVFVLNSTAATAYYDPIRVCLIFCGDTRSFAFASLLTFTIFASRYFFYTLWRPGQCLILRGRIHYSVHRDRRQHSVSQMCTLSSPSSAAAGSSSSGLDPV